MLNTLPFRSFLRSKLKCWVPRRQLSSMHGNSLISAKALNSLLSQDEVPIVVLDSTWHLGGPPEGVLESRRGWEACHIPGSLFFDIDEISDPSSSLPHTMPKNVAQFEERLQQSLYLEKDDILFDKQTMICAYIQPHSMFTAPRCWWMFKSFGYEHVMVLDGGLQAWKDEGLPVAAYSPAKEKRRKISNSNIGDGNDPPHFFHDLSTVLENLETQKYQVVDARSNGRFQGTVPEPRKGVSGGHVPSSKSLCFSDLVLGDGNGVSKLKDREEIVRLVENAGVDLSKPLITTCGSGVTACVLTYAIHIATGKPLDELGVFDGSWTEYGSDPTTPKELGPS